MLDDSLSLFSSAHMSSQMPEHVIKSSIFHYTYMFGTLIRHGIVLSFRHYRAFASAALMLSIGLQSSSIDAAML